MTSPLLQAALSRHPAAGEEMTVVPSRAEDKEVTSSVHKISALLLREESEKFRWILDEQRRMFWKVVGGQTSSVVTQPPGGATVRRVPGLVEEP